MVKLIWKKGFQFEVEDEHQHKIIVDTFKDTGGSDTGFRPMDLLLGALGACMAMDIVTILQKKGGKIDRFEVMVQGERQDEHPKKFRKIKVRFKCEGDYKREDLLRSFELSRDKYCSVSATLRATPELEFVV